MSSKCFAEDLKVAMQLLCNPAFIPWVVMRHIRVWLLRDNPKMIFIFFLKNISMGWELGLGRGRDVCQERSKRSNK